MNDLIRQAQQMQQKMAEIQEDVGKQTVEASAGGGMVTVTVTGKQEITNIAIDPSVVDPNDVDMLQDLVVSAVNEGMKKAKKLMEESISEITGGMNIPGLF
ncbi:MAG: YbaB/EbfC family nucleoid-associated protein [Thermodesulfobacteriota bacterium]